MKAQRNGFFLVVVGFWIASPAAMAGPIRPITVQVGDNDGYGFAVPDNGTAIWPGLGVFGSNYDGRSPAEVALTNGAQITDVYSAIFPTFGPNGFTSATVLFPLPLSTAMISGTLTIDMGDFQPSTFGFISAAINGVGTSLLSFNDGFQNTAVRSLALTHEQIVAANSAGQLILSFNRFRSDDFIAFDYFQLDADVVPEPGTLLLIGSGLAAAGFHRRRQRRRQS